MEANGARIVNLGNMAAVLLGALSSIAGIITFLFHVKKRIDSGELPNFSRKAKLNRLVQNLRDTSVRSKEAIAASFDKNLRASLPLISSQIQRRQSREIVRLCLEDSEGKPLTVVQKRSIMGGTFFYIAIILWILNSALSNSAVYLVYIALEIAVILLLLATFFCFLTSALYYIFNVGSFCGLLRARRKRSNAEKRYSSSSLSIFDVENYCKNNARIVFIDATCGPVPRRYNYPGHEYGAYAIEGDYGALQELSEDKHFKKDYIESFKKYCLDRLEWLIQTQSIHHDDTVFVFSRYGIDSIFVEHYLKRYYGFAQVYSLGESENNRELIDREIEVMGINQRYGLFDY